MIGRYAEQRRLRQIVASSEAEFVVVYGRRRVGKTYLVRETFAGDLTFAYTGVANVPASVQREQFVRSLREHGHAVTGQVRDWFDAFAELRAFLQARRDGSPLIIFLDELPWMDNRKSDFLSALEHFWNDWASQVKELTMIACGSATAWITKKVFRSTGGLFNRVTQQIHLRPFVLAECREYLETKGIHWNLHDIVEAYMIFGGIPYYLNLLSRGGSLAQSVDELCFAEDARLAGEFEQLFATLFAEPSRHIAVVRALVRKKCGLTRQEIARSVDFPDGGNLTRLLRELEESDFVRHYRPFGKAKKEALWQLTDSFTGFYLTFVEQHGPGQLWTAFLDHPRHRVWSGYAFEQVCLMHIPQIRAGLGISGVLQDVSSWRSNGSPGAQVDLVIDRNDNVINLCEMKYASSLFEIDKRVDQDLRTKADVFRRETLTRKAVHLTLVTTYGLKPGQYASLFQNVVSMDDLFRSPR